MSCVYWHVSAAVSSATAVFSILAQGAFHARVFRCDTFALKTKSSVKSIVFGEYNVCMHAVACLYNVLLSTSDERVQVRTIAACHVVLLFCTRNLAFDITCWHLFCLITS